MLLVASSRQDQLAGFLNSVYADLIKALELVSNRRASRSQQNGITEEIKLPGE